MKKLILFGLIFAGVSFSSFANEAEKKLDCVGILTNNFEVNSQSFTLDSDHYSLRDYGNDVMAQSIALIRILVKEQGCHPKSVNFGRGTFGRSLHSCQTLARGRNASQVCYIETNLGSFIVTLDFETLVHIIFKAWD